MRKCVIRQELVHLLHDLLHLYRLLESVFMQKYLFVALKNSLIHNNTNKLLNII